MLKFTRAALLTITACAVTTCAQAKPIDKTTAAQDDVGVTLTNETDQSVQVNIGDINCRAIKEQKISPGGELEITQDITKGEHYIIRAVVDARPGHYTEKQICQPPEPKVFVKCVVGGHMIPMFGPDNQSQYKVTASEKDGSWYTSCCRKGLLGC